MRSASDAPADLMSRGGPWPGGRAWTRPACTTTGVTAGVLRPGEVRLDSPRAATLLRTRLRGVTELLAV
ncbi:hypothetical protein [Micromonospora sp. NPDC003816]|uniref:hypothetical protein n=1 Tax=Micromonospora sp. NPDC003816 TaxID=3364224 RepID=UPI003677AECB